MERWWRWTQQLTKVERRPFFSPAEASCMYRLPVLSLVLFEETVSLVGNTWISCQFRTGVGLILLSQMQMEEDKTISLPSGPRRAFYFLWPLSFFWSWKSSSCTEISMGWKNKIKCAKTNGWVNKCLLHRNRKYSNLTFKSQVDVLPMQSSWVTADLTSSSWCR